MRLNWQRQQPTGTRASYAIFRDPADQVRCTPQGNGASSCAFAGTQVAAVTGAVTSYTDHPPPGTWTYRVGLSETAYGPQAPANEILISRPVTVVARR